jgi:uncharacterized membrane-anchored protein YhcB (DUF1043 family)
MKQLKELQKEEAQLYLVEETIEHEENQVKQIRENYEQHFHEAHHFLDNLCYQYNKNEQGRFYQSLMDEYSQKSKQMLEQLETDETELHEQKKKVLSQLEDIGYEKRRILVEEEDDEC